MVRMRMNGPGIERIRTRAQAMLLTQRDMAGPLLTVLGEENVRQVRRAFASRGATVATGPWPSLTARYAKWKAKMGYGTAMMKMAKEYRGRAAALLFSEFTQVMHPAHIRRWVGPGLRFQFGAADDVAFFHQNAAGPLPQRSVIDKTDDDYRHFKDVFLDFYRKRIAQALRYA